MAQDAIQVASHLYTVVFENERVRLLRVRMQPGDMSELHSHPDYVVYALTDATITFNLPNGEGVDVGMNVGDVMWRDTEEHSATNNGSKEVDALLFELKG